MTRAWLLAGCMLLTAAVAATAQQDPPDVGAHFVLESEAFKDGLGDEAASDLEARLSRYMASELEGHFTFLNWVTEADTGALAATRMVFKMVDNDLTNACHPDSRLVVRVVRGADEIELQDVPEVPLYTACDFDYPNQPEDVDELAARLELEVSKLLDNAQLRRDRLHAKFLQHISLSDRVVLLPEDARVVLPLRCRDLVPDRDRTVVRVGFKVAGMNNVGEMTLRVAAQSDELVTCKIVDFDFAPVLEFTSPDSWHPDLETVLDETQLEELSVYLTSYERDDFVCDEFVGSGALAEPF